MSLALPDPVLPRIMRELRRAPAQRALAELAAREARIEERGPATRPPWRGSSKR
jgi:hypothetical protein